MSWEAISVIASLSFGIIGGSFGFYRYLKEKRILVDIVPVKFQKAYDMQVSAGVGNEWDGMGVHVISASIGYKPASLTVKLKNVGGKPVSLDRITVFDHFKKHRYGTVESPGLRLEIEDIQHATIEMPARNGKHYTEPPDGIAIIEVATATKTFYSKPFRFSDFLP